MEPEQLKVIAEGMGYELNERGYPVKYKGMEVFFLHVSDEQPYNPLTNNDQMVEIMERLEIDVEYTKYGVETGLIVNTKNYYGKGKTINEAVCNAAYEYFKVK